MEVINNLLRTYRTFRHNYCPRTIQDTKTKYFNPNKNSDQHLRLLRCDILTTSIFIVKLNPLSLK